MRIHAIDELTAYMGMAWETIPTAKKLVVYPNKRMCLMRQ